MSSVGFNTVNTLNQGSNNQTVVPSYSKAISIQKQQQQQQQPHQSIQHPLSPKKATSLPVSPPHMVRSRSRSLLDHQRETLSNSFLIDDEFSTELVLNCCASHVPRNLRLGLLAIVAQGFTRPKKRPHPGRTKTKV